jgi:hypothetical protein
MKHLEFELQRKLIAAARQNAPSESVPYAFEKRVMARLAGIPAVDAWAVWAAALWRAAVPCVAAMILFSAWTIFVTGNHGAANDLFQEFDNTVLAAAVQESTSDLTW